MNKKITCSYTRSKQTLTVGDLIRKLSCYNDYLPVKIEHGEYEQVTATDVVMVYDNLNEDYVMIRWE